MLPPCNCVRRNCAAVLSEADRKKAFETYYSLQTHEEQWIFLNGLIQNNATKTRATDTEKNRNFSPSYFIPFQSTKVQVCRKMFLNTFNITEGTVKGIILKGQTCQFNDKRGKKGNLNTVLAIAREYVVEHIKSFPVMPAHYVRKDDHKMYLPAELTLEKMFAMYLPWFDEKNLEEKYKVSIRQYRDVFNKFDLSFYRRKKDQCSTCKNFEHEGIGAGNDEYEEHRRQIEEARKAKELDKAEAVIKKNLCTASYDLQKILTCPITNNSLAFYKTSYHCLNFSVFDMGSKQGHNFFWEERDGGKGCKEIIGCLEKFILEKVASGYTEFRFYSDNCWPQNKNQYLFTFYVWMAKKFNISITHRYLIKGHTQMEVDSIHALIEKSKGQSEIFTPSDWEFVIRNAKKTGAPYRFHRMEYKDFKSTETFASHGNFKDLPISKISWIQIQKENPFNITYSTLDLNTVQEINIGSREMNYTISRAERLPMAYKSKKNLNAAKKADLKSLMKSKVIPKSHWSFYKDFIEITDSESE